MRHFAKVVWKFGRLAAFIISALAPPAVSQQLQITVDMELVLAVDTSESMDQNGLILQRLGYVEAFRAKEVARAISSGPEGRIAVTFMEWGGPNEQNQLVPWTIIDSEAAAHAFADRLEREGVRGFTRTSISDALYMAAGLIDNNDIASHRKVIDVSGDGPNNSGLEVDIARDNVVARGFTINGLPIMLPKLKASNEDIDHLDRYYRQCVVGGQGPFIAPMFGWRQLAATVRKKLVMEIAGNEIAPPGTAPLQFAESSPSSGIQRVQLKLPTQKVDCQIGEKRSQPGYRGIRGGGALQ
jgi:hypothetical protein